MTCFILIFINLINFNALFKNKFIADNAFYFYNVDGYSTMNKIEKAEVYE